MKLGTGVHKKLGNVCLQNFDKNVYLDQKYTQFFVTFHYFYLQIV